MAEDTSLTTPTNTPSSTNGNPFAIAGLVCGLVGLIFLHIVLGPLALIFGGIGWSKANRGAPYRGMAIAAVVLGVLDLLVLVVAVVYLKNSGYTSFRLGG